MFLMWNCFQSEFDVFHCDVLLQAMSAWNWLVLSTGPKIKYKEFLIYIYI